MKKIILIKFGGSLITDKNKVNVARFNVIDSLSRQIKEILDREKDRSIIIATGAGGFGHPLAEKYKNNLGTGLLEIKKAVKKINQIVVDSLNREGIKAESVEPSKIAKYKNGKMVSFLHDFIASLLNNNIIPTFHADLIDDQKLGISILSMDRFLIDLAIELKNKDFEVEKIIFCGTTNGVLSEKKETIKKINKKNFPELDKYFFENKQVDTTGGMRKKVEECLRLIDQKIGCVIINGQEENSLRKFVFEEEKKGTTIIE